MKATAWSRFARRTAIMAAGVCCLAILTGCPWDDDDDVPKKWTLTWTNDETDLSPLTVPVTWGDLDDLDEFETSAGGYTVMIVRDGDQVGVLIVADDPDNLFMLLADGDVINSTTAEGYYGGMDSDGDEISGTWSLVGD
ncbi:hypothetical protein [Pontiella sp.]|uniref:hypothetical protein n=1 Tax=Pontiella sp. TaxID=2837462 RepID=UPI003567332C